MTIGQRFPTTGVNIVVNYDMPDSSDTYLHRVGRAGRFGTKGLAITFASDDNDAKILESVQVPPQDHLATANCLPRRARLLDELAEILGAHRLAEHAVRAVDGAPLPISRGGCGAVGQRDHVESFLVRCAHRRLHTAVGQEPTKLRSAKQDG